MCRSAAGPGVRAGSVRRIPLRTTRWAGCSPVPELLPRHEGRRRDRLPPQVGRGAVTTGRVGSRSPSGSWRSSFAGQVGECGRRRSAAAGRTRRRPLRLGEDRGTRPRRRRRGALAAGSSLPVRGRLGDQVCQRRVDPLVAGQQLVGQHGSGCAVLRGRRCSTTAARARPPRRRRGRAARRPLRSRSRCARAASRPRPSGGTGGRRRRGRRPAGRSCRPGRRRAPGSCTTCRTAAAAATPAPPGR